MRVVSYTPINILVLISLFILSSKDFITNSVKVDNAATTTKRIATQKIIHAIFSEIITPDILNT